MEVVYAIIGLVIGMALTYVAIHSRVTVTNSKYDMLSELLQNKEKEYSVRMGEMAAQHTKEIENVREQNIKEHNAILLAHTKEIENIRQIHEQEVSNIKAQCASQIAVMKDSHEKLYDELKTQNEKNLNEFREQQQNQLKQQLNLLNEQMNNTSERILRERSEQLSVMNKEQLSQILNPFQTGIQQMKEAVEKSGRDNMTSMERLDASIKTTLDKANMLSETANKLSNALTGENKIQGNFGEVKLKQLLEDMGLEEGVLFEEQVAMRDDDGRVIYEEDGHRLIPDVILHFPDNRDVVIDSKVSLTAFIESQNANSEAEREEALKRHVASVRAHVNELSKKNYSRYIQKGHGKLDFVMMYVFQESALQQAVVHDPTLWKEAYDKGVVISGSQNLYMMLRVLEMTWKQVRQIENQEEMMRCANNIIDRVQMFCERFQKVEDCFIKTQDAIKDVKNITATNGTSITTAAVNLLKYGAKENPKRKKRLSRTCDEIVSNMAVEE